jgi:hypothetical protein
MRGHDRERSAAADPRFCSPGSLREPAVELVREGWFGLAAIALLLAPPLGVYLLAHAAGASVPAAQAGAAGALLAWLLFLARQGQRSTRLAKALAGLLMPLGEPRGL